MTDKLVDPCPHGKCRAVTTGCWGECSIDAERKKLEDAFVMVPSDEYNSLIAAKGEWRTKHDAVVSVGQKRIAELDAALTRERAAREEAEKWRPMDTVPKNATEILVLAQDRYGNKYRIVLHWAHGGGEDQPQFGPSLFYHVGDGYAEFRDKAFGWRPLPDKAVDAARTGGSDR